MEGMRFDVGELVGERWGQGAPDYVLLHAGIADRRSWRDVAPALDAPAVAYDRRGFGETPPPDGDFRHLDDLLAVLDAVAGGEPVWLVGNSMGGALAIDAALEAPERVAGLVLIGPGVGGDTAGLEPPALEGADAEIDAAFRAADDDDDEELLRLEAWLWLDGPAEEGRVGGAARELAFAMNRQIHENGVDDAAGDSGIEAFARLGELQLPVTVAWGDLENAEQVALCEAIAEGIPGARRVVLPGTAHLPGLDAPAALAGVIVQARTSGR
jgi:pimeloyl-ACP methyl ester carboxylesterase